MDLLLMPTNSPPLATVARYYPSKETTPYPDQAVINCPCYSIGSNDNLINYSLYSHDPLHRVDLILNHPEIRSSSQPLVKRSLHVRRLLITPAYLSPTDVALVTLVRNEEIALPEAKVNSSLNCILFILLLNGEELVVIQ